MNKQEEQTLRENIRHLIKYVKTKNQQEKDLFRESLKTLAKLELSHMLTEGDVADTKTIMTAIAIDHINPSIHVVVEVLQSENVPYFSYTHANFLV